MRRGRISHEDEDAGTEFGVVVQLQAVMDGISLT